MATGEFLTVSSADGTKIGFERRGAGPALVAVHGATADRHRWEPVADALAEHYTLHLVDRRGRGLSGDSDGEYAIAREAEDVAAVVASIGGPVLLLGHSYGALSSLEAGLICDDIAAMLLYEPPFATPGHLAVPPDALVRVQQLLDGGQREAALEIFYREAVGVAQAGIEAMKAGSMWQRRIAIVHTLVREGREVNAYTADPDRLRQLKMPVRFLVGTTSPAALQASTAAAAAAVPGSELVELVGQGHTAIDAVPGEFVAQVLAFLKAT
jgi:pimeloyl-ACP methyl ester carboxylesterase